MIDSRIVACAVLRIDDEDCGSCVVLARYKPHVTMTASSDVYKTAKTLSPHVSTIRRQVNSVMLTENLE